MSRYRSSRSSQPQQADSYLQVGESRYAIHTPNVTPHPFGDFPSTHVIPPYMHSTQGRPSRVPNLYSDIVHEYYDPMRPTSRRPIYIGSYTPPTQGPQPLSDPYSHDFSPTSNPRVVQVPKVHSNPTTYVQTDVRDSKHQKHRSSGRKGDAGIAEKEHEKIYDDIKKDCKRGPKIIQERQRERQGTAASTKTSRSIPDRVFNSAWELPDVVDGIPDKKSYLLKALTLTRSKTRVRVTTCESYIMERYGPTGLALLDIIVQALDQICGTSESPGILIKTHRDSIIVLLDDSNSNLWNLLTWLCLTFRQPEPGKIALSTGETTHEGLKLAPLAGSFALGKNCWLSLFETAIIAMEPRVRPSEESFLDIDFGLMLQLAAVEYPVRVESGLVLLGYSTALVPVEEVDNRTILWHLETADDDSQLKATQLQATKGKWVKKRTLESLGSKRALLGWCPEAVTLLGTASLNFPMRWSDAKEKRTTWKWKGANLQFIATTTSPLQIGAQAGMTFDRSINTLRFSPGSNYLKCLNHSSKEQVVLYDVGESRAWLVPLICVYHQMLVAYWHRIPEGSRKATIPLSIPSFDGASASLAALRDSGGYVIQGSRRDRLTVRDLILGFSVNLSKMSLRPPVRSEIYGYEFMDIVTDSPESELKRCRMVKTGLPWTPLLSRVNCLFCSGLGDAIYGHRTTARDSPCNKLPQGLDWLAASMCSIEALSDRHSNKDMEIARRLSSQHYWFLTGTPFQTCQHGQGTRVSCWDTSPILQDIKRRMPQVWCKADEHYGHGAVVFGRRKAAIDQSPPPLAQMGQKSSRSNMLANYIHRLKLDKAIPTDLNQQQRA
ncbi:hypothetical protein BDV59DRAFT_180152 [Aspergillus ambiguus]|uniref:uncharacterized protein n=1 Tax=Aspergillus ambiguus TaxID=176160 RepID=UPI003CCDCCD8